VDPPSPEAATIKLQQQEIALQGQDLDGLKKSGLKLAAQPAVDKDPYTPTGHVLTSSKSFVRKTPVVGLARDIS
jgi:hypothetical protein